MSATRPHPQPFENAMSLHPVCPVEQLPQGHSTTTSLNGKTVAVFNDNGCLFAIDDMCPHMGASLAGGFVEDGVVTCPWHYWRFRLSDGAWADNPRVKIGQYPVEVVDGRIHLQVAPVADPEKKPG
jgi:nitrite reductase (NADH) small subunit